MGEYRIVSWWADDLVLGRSGLTSIVRPLLVKIEVGRGRISCENNYLKCECWLWFVA
ncbi:hypothetical protein QUA79_29875 [Microcoleus sp. F8-D1]